jgi:hypothetical protein
MGLELVEIVFEVERDFHLRFDNSKLGRLKTVGDLYLLILQTLNLETSSACLSTVMFYRLRRAIVEIAGVSRSAVRLDTPLDRFFPTASRVEQWSRLAEVIGWNAGFKSCIGPPFVNWYSSFSGGSPAYPRLGSP